MTQNPKTSLKKTNIPWIWEIPEDWEVKKLKFVFKYVTWWTPSSGKSDYYDSENGYNWMTIADLDWKYTGESKNKITELAVKETNMRIVPKWSLLYSFKLSVGQLAFVSEDTYTNEAILSILPKEWLNLDFWYYALQAYFISNANENIYWAKIFNQFTIDNGLVIVPSYSDQIAIANFLDQKTAEIKKFVENKKKLINLLKEQKQSIIHRAVTKGIDPNTKMKESGIDWIWEIPVDWEVRRVKDASYINSEKLWEKYEKDFTIKYIEIENIDNWKIVKEPEDMLFSSAPSRARRVCQKWDVLISTVRTYLRAVAQIELEEQNLICSTWFAVLRSNQEFLHIDYLFYLVFSTFFIESVCQLSDWVSYPAINEQVLARIKVSIPPKHTQKLILEYLKQETSQIDSAIAKIEQEITLIEEYRTSFIYQTVTGKISIS